MAKRGRKSKLTPDVIQRIAGYVRLGNYEHVAAQACGIAPKTLANWKLKEGKLYTDLRESLMQAHAEAQIRFVSRVAASALGRPAKYDQNGTLVEPAIPPNTTDAKWMLSRRFRREFGDDVSVIMDPAPELPESQPQAPQGPNLAEMSTEDLELLERLLEGATARELPERQEATTIDAVAVRTERVER